MVVREPETLLGHPTLFARNCTSNSVRKIDFEEASLRKVCWEAAGVCGSPWAINTAGFNGSHCARGPCQTGIWHAGAAATGLWKSQVAVDTLVETLWPRSCPRQPVPKFQSGGSDESNHVLITQEEVIMNDTWHTPGQSYFQRYFLYAQFHFWFLKLLFPNETPTAVSAVCMSFKHVNAQCTSRVWFLVLSGVLRCHPDSPNIDNHQLYRKCKHKHNSRYISIVYLHVNLPLYTQKKQRF